jgi:hypothetical protein
VHGQSVAAMVEVRGWSTGCLLIAIIGKRYATRVDLGFDKAFVIIDRQVPYGGNVAPLIAE